MITMDEPCDHVFELVDEPFESEFGTEPVMYWRCLVCDKIEEVGSQDLEEYML